MKFVALNADPVILVLFPVALCSNFTCEIPLVSENEALKVTLNALYTTCGLEDAAMKLGKVLSTVSIRDCVFWFPAPSSAVKRSVQFPSEEQPSWDDVFAEIQRVVFETCERAVLFTFTLETTNASVTFAVKLIRSDAARMPLSSLVLALMMVGAVWSMERSRSSELLRLLTLSLAVIPKTQTTSTDPLQS